MKPSDAGAAAVEMAFMLLLLLWLVLGIVDMGRAIYTNIAVQEAAQAGVAYAAFTESADISSVEGTVVASTDSLTLEAGDIDVACTEVSRAGQDGGQVRVTVRVSLDYITPLVGDALGGGIDLARTVEAERFFESCSGLQEVPW